MTMNRTAPCLRHAGSIAFKRATTFKKHLMVLDLSQPSDNPDQNRMVRYAKLMAKLCATRRVIREDAQVQAQRNHFDLPAAPDAKRLTNLDALLLAEHNQTIRNQSRQKSFDREKQLRSTPPVVTMKNVTVIRVYKLALRVAFLSESLASTNDKETRPYVQLFRLSLCACERCLVVHAGKA